jgi:ABC-2 type transport system permease protein
MALIDSRPAAILWAQWRTILNFYRKPQMGGYWVGTIVMGLWYLMLAGAGTALAFGLPKVKPSQFDRFEFILTFGFLAAFLYWQVVPVFMASTGMSLDARKLIVYPVPERELFAIEVLLRFSTGIEVLLLLAGTFIGLLLNSEIPFWGPFTILLFVAFNLFLSTGIKDWVSRLMERKGLREAALLLLLLLLVSPQMVVLIGLPPGVRAALSAFDQRFFPWGVTASLALGKNPLLNLPLLLAYLAAAVWFGRWQFHRGLHFDVDAARAASGHGGTTSASPWVDAFFSWPRFLFSDPLAALLEKELRNLARSSRFRLVFFMGFTFGLVVWLPLIFRGGVFSGGGAFESNFLTLVSVYSVLMLGEVSLFNNLGFDRSAAQLYFIAPVSLPTVLRAKNIAASVYILLELTLVTLACLLLRLPVSLTNIAEAFAVTLVLAMFFAALGNLGSIYYPRAADSQSSWRSRGASKFQFWMLLAYPVLGVPISLAYLARYAFDSQLAFFATLGFAFLLSLVFYTVATSTAQEAAIERREQILAALSEGQGPIAT